MPALHPKEGMASRVAAVAVGMFSLRPPDIVDCWPMMHDLSDLLPLPLLTRQSYALISVCRMSRAGGLPNKRPYSRVNCCTLS